MRTKLLVLSMLIGLVFLASFAGAESVVRIHGVYQEQLDILFGDWAAEKGIRLVSAGARIEELGDQFILQALSGMPIDIARTDPARTLDLWAAGYLEDLTPWLSAEGIELAEMFHAGTWIEGYGGIWAMPVDVSTRTLYYSPRLFAEAGLESPPQTFSAPGWDWDEFVRTLLHLTMDVDGDGVPDQYGLSYHPGLQQLYKLWGGDYFNEDRTAFLGGTEQVLVGLEALIDLRWTYDVVGGRFRSATAALHYDGNWRQQTIDDAGVEWDLTVPPRAVQRFAPMYTNGLVMCRVSENKEAAWEFIKYVSLDPEGIAKWVEITDRIPSSKRGVTVFFPVANSRFPGKRHQIWAEAVQYGHIETVQYFSNRTEITGLIDSAWAYAWEGKQDIRTVMSQIEMVMEYYIQDHLSFLAERGVLP